ncbi:MAG TPA: hypothetical protein VI997_01825, partial [Candidatus Thermoplasmatota archaeon]|nr:hypothetical protein [Candidatus Thermoplasmatota archaeon]
RVADRAVPGVKAPAEMTADERATVYAAQARLAWEDGHVDARDREVLDRLRATLGLAAEDAMRIESDAMAPIRHVDVA